MKKCIPYIFVTVVVIFLVSCELIVDVVSDDSVDTFTYFVDHQLTELLLRADMDLEIIESDDSLLVITGAKAVLDNITIENEDGRLTVNYKKLGSWMYDKPQLQLRMPKIDKISLYAYNDVFATDTLRTDNIYIFSDGTGDVNLKVNCKNFRVFGNNISNFYISGKAESLSVCCSYSSSFKGAHLIAQKVSVNSYAANEQVVYPVKSLSCSIRLTGNIYYVNQPEKLAVNIIEGAKGQAIYDNNRQ